MNAQLAPEVLAPTGTAVAEYSQTAAGLAALREQIADATFDCTTTTGDREARQTRLTLVRLRTALEDKRKELKAPLLAKSALIDAEAKRITGEIVALELPIDTLIRAEEQRKELVRQERERAEAERLAAINAQIERIRSLPLTYVAASTAVLQEAIAELATTDCAAIFDESHAPRAEEVKSAALEGLGRALEARIAADQEAARLAVERAELERQRAEQAAAQKVADEQAKRERDEADRIAREQREVAAAAARVEQERIAAEQQVERERLSAERAELEAHQAAARKAAQKAADQKAAKDAKKRADDEQRAIDNATVYEVMAEALQRFQEIGEGDSLLARKLTAVMGKYA